MIHELIYTYLSQTDKLKLSLRLNYHEWRSYAVCDHSSSYAFAPRNDFTPGGGVPALVVVVLPKLNLGFFSAGFNI